MKPRRHRPPAIDQAAMQLWSWSSMKLRLDRLAREIRTGERTDPDAETLEEIERWTDDMLDEAISMLPRRLGQ